MLLAVLSVALGAKPDDVDLDDIDRWESAANRLLDGPDGCWDVVGRASWNWDFARFGLSRGDAVFTARLVDHVWVDWHLEPLGEVRRRGRGPQDLVFDRTDEPRFVPLVGKVEDDEETEDARTGAVNALNRGLDRITSDVSTSDVRWDDGKNGVVFSSFAGLESNKDKAVRIEVFFPEGQALPSRQTVAVPDFTRRLARITDAKVDIRGRPQQGDVFPTAESASFGVRFMGFVFSGAQTVRYTHARRCSGG